MFWRCPGSVWQTGEIKERLGLGTYGNSECPGHPLKGQGTQAQSWDAGPTAGAPAFALPSSWSRKRKQGRAPYPISGPQRDLDGGQVGFDPGLKELRGARMTGREWAWQSEKDQGQRARGMRGTMRGRGHQATMVTVLIFPSWTLS